MDTIKYLALIVALVLGFPPFVEMFTVDTKPIVTAQPRVFSQEYTFAVPTDMSAKVKWCFERKPCKKLAEAIVYEARGESAIGQYAVAWVILNRKERKRWPDTITEVVHQRKQFSYLGDMAHQKKPTNKDWTNGYVVAYDVLNGKVESPVGGATHYHTLKVSPKWANKLTLVAQIDNHRFYE